MINTINSKNFCYLVKAGNPNALDKSIPNSKIKFVSEIFNKEFYVFRSVGYLKKVYMKEVCEIWQIIDSGLYLMLDIRTSEESSKFCTLYFISSKEANTPEELLEFQHNLGLDAIVKDLQDQLENQFDARLFSLNKEFS